MCRLCLSLGALLQRATEDRMGYGDEGSPRETAVGRDPRISPQPLLCLLFKASIYQGAGREGSWRWEGAQRG